MYSLIAVNNSNVCQIQSEYNFKSFRTKFNYISNILYQVNLENITVSLCQDKKNKFKRLTNKQLKKIQSKKKIKKN